MQRIWELWSSMATVAKGVPCKATGSKLSVMDRPVHLGNSMTTMMKKQAWHRTTMVNYRPSQWTTEGTKWAKPLDRMRLCSPKKNQMKRKAQVEKRSRVVKAVLSIAKQILQQGAYLAKHLIQEEAPIDNSWTQKRLWLLGQPHETLVIARPGLGSSIITGRPLVPQVMVRMNWL